MLNADYDPGNISFEFTRDSALLSEYFAVRDQVYTEFFKLPSAEVIHDDYDSMDSTDFLVVCDNGKAIGGARAIFRTPENKILLPFEHEHFKLVDILPELELESKIYCEVDRTVLLPKYRNGDVGREIVRQTGYYGKLAREAEFVFTVNPKVQIRNNKRHVQSIGANFTICNDISIPNTLAFNGVKMSLAFTDLRVLPPVEESERLFPFKL